MQKSRKTSETISDLVAAWQENLRGRFTADAAWAPCEATTAPWPPALDPRIVAGLESLGVKALYGHQAEAFSVAAGGKNAVIATPTASGKSLCYHLPVLHDLARDPAARALYVFPTKALARDQEESLARLLQATGISAKMAVYDGDTPDEARRTAKREARILITNPDMLHTGILPHHTSFAPLFSGLRRVVIDEIHQYRGVFGSHVANVVRRLGRVAAFHGASPVFTACSATIGNPGELSRAVIGAEVSEIATSGAARGPRRFLLYNPEVVEPTLGLRRSALKVAAKLAAELVEAGVTVLVFCQTRRGVEVVLRYLRSRIQNAGRSPERVRGYRGGYLPQLRREIENALREGALDAVVATNALELGIDVGGLDAVVMAGYPGTVAATFQRAGRAGRRGEPALAVLVAGTSPLDQFLAREPEFLLDTSPERALVSPDNIEILLPHLACAAFELPFRARESFGSLGPEDTAAALDALAKDGLLALARGSYHFVGASYPAAEVSLRSAGGKRVVAVDAETGTPITEVEPRTARRELHERAVYQHEGATYLVTSLDLDGGRAVLRPSPVPYYTVAVEHAFVRVERQLREKPLASGGRAADGDATVHEEVAAFKKIRFETHENLGAEELSLPAEEMQTEALWIEPGPAAAAALGGSLARALEGVGFALHHVAALRLMCDPKDVGTVVQAAPGNAPDGSPSGDRLALFLYDAHSGGVGLSGRAFEELDILFEDAARLAGGCPCADGCPSCVGPPEDEGVSRKKLTEALLAALLCAHGGEA